MIRSRDSPHLARNGSVCTRGQRCLHRCRDRRPSSGPIRALLTQPRWRRKKRWASFSFRPRRVLMFSGCYSVGTLGIEKERNSPLSLSPASPSSSPYAVTPPLPPPSIDSRPSHFDCALRSAAGKLSVWRLCRLRVKQVSNLSVAVNGCVCNGSRVLMVVLV